MSRHCYVCGNEVDDGFMLMGRFMCRNCEQSTLEDGSHRDRREETSRNFLVKLASDINQNHGGNWGTGM